MYRPENHQIEIGLRGVVNWGGIRAYPENQDPPGSMKHEIGHVIYRAKNLASSKELKEAYQREAASLSDQQRIDLAHLLGENGFDAESEACAELYAALRGRNTGRAKLTAQCFPETKKILERMLNESNNDT